MFIPFDPPPSSFVTTLKGFVFLHGSDTRTEAAVTEIVANALFSDDNNPELPTRVRRFIANHRDNIPHDIINIEDALRYVRTSIAVKRLNLVKRDDVNTGGGESHPAWNIYIFPPTTEQTALREWREIIRRTTFITDTNEAGHSARLFNCSVCRSEDHPTGMCPYPTQRGWTAPGPANSPALEAVLNSTQNSHNGRGTNRGGRGSQPNTRGRSANIRRGKTTART